MDEKPDQERIDDGDGGCLGRREDAAEDAAQDHHGHEQGGQRVDEALADLAQCRHLAARVPAARASDMDGPAGEADAEQQPRHDARDEEVGDRYVGHEGEDDHRDRGRDDDADGAGDRDQGGGEGEAVAAALHARDHDRADGGAVGHRRARHAGEQHAGRDRDEAQAAGHEAQEPGREGDETLADATLGHQLAGQDEERDGEEVVRLDAADEGEGHRLQRIDLGEDDDEAEDGEGHREGERHPDQGEGHEETEEIESFHGPAPLRPRPAGRRARAGRSAGGRKPASGARSPGRRHRACRSASSARSSARPCW